MLAQPSTQAAAGDRLGVGGRHVDQHEPVLAGDGVAEQGARAPGQRVLAEVGMQVGRGDQGDLGDVAEQGGSLQVVVAAGHRVGPAVKDSVPVLDARARRRGAAARAAAGGIAAGASAETRRTKREADMAGTMSAGAMPANSSGSSPGTSTRSASSCGRARPLACS